MRNWACEGEIKKDKINIIFDTLWKSIKVSFLK